jgi:hypothetical protein
MKLRFLCANHREWLHSRPDQAIHWCANSFETGWHLSQEKHWKDAFAHMGCAFETAEILLTTRAIAPSNAVAWFIRTLDGLVQTLQELRLTEACVELYQSAIDRLVQEVSSTVSPELEADLYAQISRLNRSRRRLDSSSLTPVPIANLREVAQGDIVLH